MSKSTNKTNFAAVEAAVQEVSPTSATTHDEAGTSEHQRVEIDR